MSMTRIPTRSSQNPQKTRRKNPSHIHVSPRFGGSAVLTVVEGRIEILFAVRAGGITHGESLQRGTNSSGRVTRFPTQYRWSDQEMAVFRQQSKIFRKLMRRTPREGSARSNECPLRSVSAYFVRCLCQEEFLHFLSAC